LCPCRCRSGCRASASPTPAFICLRASAASVDYPVAQQQPWPETHRHQQELSIRRGCSPRASSSLRDPATCFMALIWAADPTPAEEDAVVASPTWICSRANGEHEEEELDHCNLVFLRERWIPGKLERILRVTSGARSGGSPTTLSSTGRPPQQMYQ